MPKPYLLLALILPAGVTGLPAQTDYYARIGAVGASNLLRDAIVSEITVRQSIAPMFVLGGSVPISQGYRAGLEGTFATGGFHSTENGSETDLGTLSTGSLMLDLEGPIRSGVSWRIGLGALHYFPSDDSGVFASGGTTRFLAGAGADWRHSVSARWDLMAGLRYDYHQFTTAELKARGFAQSQQVSRVALTIGLARGRS